MTRVGPSGQAVRERMVRILDEQGKEVGRYLPKDRRVPFWKRPWWFELRYYTGEDYQDDFKLKPGAHPSRVKRFRFTWELMGSFNSFNHLPPPSLVYLLDELGKWAPQMANLDAWRLDGRGALTQVAVPDEFYKSLMFPVSTAQVEQELKAQKQRLDTQRQEVIDMVREIQLRNLDVLPASEVTRYPVVTRQGEWQSAQEILAHWGV